MKLKRKLFLLFGPVGEQEGNPTPGARRPASSEEGPSLRSLRVLVVDDDPSVLELLAVILEVHGASVTAVDSAATAFQMLTQTKPDVLVSDIRMPGEDGYSLIRKVRALDENEGGGTPAIAVTAYGPQEDKARAFRAGFQLHLEKPIDPEDLTRAIQALARP